MAVVIRTYVSANRLDTIRTPVMRTYGSANRLDAIRTYVLFCAAGNT